MLNNIVDLKERKKIILEDNWINISDSDSERYG